MGDPRDNRKSTDENGNEYLIGEDGEFLKDEFGDKIPPSQSRINSKDGEFTTYDSDQGNCGLCGRLSCRGGCFK